MCKFPAIEFLIQLQPLHEFWILCVMCFMRVINIWQPVNITSYTQVILKILIFFVRLYLKMPKIHKSILKYIMKVRNFDLSDCYTYLLNNTDLYKFHKIVLLSEL